MTLPLVALALGNGLSFALFGADKRQARRGAWRISERTLLASAVLSGTLGAWSGVRIFRHKVRSPSFLIRLALASLVDAAVVVFVLGTVAG